MNIDLLKRSSTGPSQKISIIIVIKFIIFHKVMIKIKLSYILDSLHTN